MTDNILLGKLDEYVKGVVDEVGYISYDVECHRVSPNGSGYMGIQYEINIKGKTHEIEKETNVFAKLMDPNAEMKIYSIPDIFNREAFAYTELANVLSDLQIKFNIPIEKQFNMIKCFKVCNQEAIILENIAKIGYKTYNRMDVLNLKYIELSIIHLAKLHALSFALERKRIEYFNEKVKILQQPFIFEKDWFDFVNNMIKSSLSYLDEDIQRKHGEKIKEKVYKYPEYMQDISSVRTLCHGDYKHNNIMVLERNGVPVEVMALDYQLLHYGNPLLDLLYLIFNGTNKKFRKDHLVYLKNLYYNTLKNFLEYFTLDIKEFFARDEYERLFKEKLDFGLMINVFYVPFLFASEDDVPDVTQPLEDITFKVDPRFGDRFREVVEDFINWGYL